MSKEPKYFQDCKNCEFVCKIDGFCNYDMFPGFEEGDPLYCERTLTTNTIHKEGKMEKQILNRKVYKEIKKYDRQQMENFTKSIYETGFTDGYKEGAKTSQEIDLKTKIVQVMQRTKGVGDKTIAKVIETINMEALEC